MQDAKGGGRQWVELSPRVVEALREQLASHKSKWVWPGSNPAEPLRGDTAYDRLRAAAKHLKLAPGLLWHSLRHAYISPPPKTEQPSLLFPIDQLEPERVHFEGFAVDDHGQLPAVGKQLYLGRSDRLAVV